ncbi:MAG: TetR family transcriptional regulator [Parvibaculum sp.]|uniref:TetR/AcrR family transcriptional regulator n=1 Tax=Parvibaculum sp. TaxID=2024848 RepID=UPI00271DA3D7|nr:TetR/AcrR family transcriptional regulator [Parvibaculum sp.]MDO8838821.1 TetR family transcriptional regulator [Parvibaculum sp.]
MAKAQGAAAQKAAGPDKRELIVSAALDLFRHYGYRRTSMEDIARAAAVAKGTLYLYFKSKDELFEAICRSLAEQIAEGVTAAEALELPLEPKLTALMEAKFGFAYRWVLSSPHAAELMESSSRLSTDFFEPVTQQFRNAVLKLIREGTARGELNPKAAGLTQEAAMDALIAAAYGAEKSPDEATFKARLAAIMRLTLRGLRA